VVAIGKRRKRISTLNEQITLFSHVRLSMMLGKSFRSSLQAFCRRYSRTRTALALLGWLVQKDIKAHQTDNELNADLKPFESLFSLGLEGHAVFELLGTLRSELSSNLDALLQEELQESPYWQLLPLLLFQFPAIFLLLFGPIVDELVRHLSM